MRRGRRPRSRPTAAAASALGVLLAACSQGTPTSTPTSDVPSSSTTVASPTMPVPASSPTVATSGPCANDYFPVVAGVEWRYRFRAGSQTDVAHQTLQVGDQGFTSLLLTPEGGRKDIWTCGRTGLTDLGQITVDANGHPTPGVVSFHGFHSVGVTVPRNLYVGAAWTQRVTSHGTVAILGVNHLERRVVTTSFRLVGEGNVTTPAGTFHVLKVEADVQMSRDIPSLGRRARSVSHRIDWVARGVGVVESTTSRPGSTGSLRLLSFHLPQ